MVDRNRAAVKDRAEWSGVFAATLCPFDDDGRIDETGLADYVSWVARHDGIRGVVVNGHTGEVTSLRNFERARVAAVAVKSVGANAKVVCGVCAEGSHDAIEQAVAAKEAGAAAVLLMPPHHWLRFGRSAETAAGFVQDVADGAGIPIVLHQYPAWTKAAYSLAEMIEIAAIPQVVCIKMGTRDMARARFDYVRLKAAAPQVSVLTCHDEFLLPSLLEGADGALVGFAGYAPGLICELVDKALGGDLAGARAVREKVDALARAIYQFGEPSAEAHQRMKMAAFLTGKIRSPVVRPPLRPLRPETVEQIKRDLAEAGEKVVR